jgi:hypothetical protein
MVEQVELQVDPGFTEERVDTGVSSAKKGKGSIAQLNQTKKSNGSEKSPTGPPLYPHSFFI